MSETLIPRPQEGEDEFSPAFNARLVEYELRRGADLSLHLPDGSEWVIPSDEGALDVWNARPEPSVQEAVAAADVWGAVANLIERGTPEDGLLFIARKNAAALRALAERGE